MNVIRRVVSAMSAFALVACIFSGCAAERLPAYGGAVSAKALGIPANGSPAVGAIDNAADSLVKDGGVLCFPAGTYNINDDTAFPAKLSVVVMKGARFEIAEGATLNVRSLCFDGPSEQIFFGDGAVKGFGGAVSVNPAWFGAIPDDGRDDSEALKKALAACGGHLELAAGRYDIASPVSIDGIKVGAAGGAFALRGSTEGKTVIRIADGITAFENRDESTGAGGYYFENLSFEGSGSGEALYLMRQVYIANCSFTNLTRGLFANKAGMSSFLNCTAENVTGTVFDIGDDTMFVYFFGNSAKKSGTLIKVIGAGAFTTGIQILNCKTEDMTGCDIYLFAAGGDTNYINGCEFSGGTGEAAVFISRVCSPHITASTITGAGNGKVGVMIDGCESVAFVSDNDISGLYAAVEIRGTKNISVTNNHCHGNTVADLRIISSDDVAVHNNSFMSAVPVSGIGVSSHVSVCDNIIAAAEFDVGSSFEIPDFVVADGNTTGATAPAEKKYEPGEEIKTEDEVIVPAPAVTFKMLSGGEKTAFVDLSSGGDAADAIENAVKSISDGGYLVFGAGEGTVSHSVSVSEKIIPVMLYGSILSVADGASISFGSDDVSYLAACRHFKGSVLFENAPYALAEWFGAARGDSDDDAAAVISAATSGAECVRLLAGIYTAEDGIAFPSGSGAVKIIGSGHGLTTVKNSGYNCELFSMKALSGDSLHLEGFSATGSSGDSVFADFGGENEDDSCSLVIRDIFGASFGTFLKTENCFLVMLEDLNLGPLADGFVFGEGTHNVTGRRSLTANMTGYFIKAEDAVSLRFINFCSVLCRKNLSASNVDGFYLSASGFDSAYGTEAVTLNFENCSDVVLETTYIASTHDLVMSFEDCERVRVTSMNFNGVSKGIYAENCTDLEISDNIFYETKKDVINLDGVKNFTGIGNHYYKCKAESSVLTAKSCENAVFAGNVCDIATTAGLNAPGVTVRGNVTDGTAVNYPDRAPEIGLKDFTALKYYDYGSTMAGACYETVNGYAVEAPTGSWFGNAGIASKEKTAVNGFSAEILLKRDNYTETSPDRNFTVMLSGARPTAFTADRFVCAGATDAPAALMLSFVFSNDGIRLMTRQNGLKNVKNISETVISSETIPTDAELDLSIAVSGSDLILTVAGKTVTVANGASVGENAYVTYFAHAYGSAGIRATVVSQNGSPLK